MALGSNLVIQQVGDVGRMQEAMQKSAELQQASAAQENQREEQLKRSQVQKSERAFTENKVSKDGKGGRNKKNAHSQSGPPKQDSEGKDAPQAGTGGLLDIIV